MLFDIVFVIAGEVSILKLIKFQSVGKGKLVGIEKCI